DTLAMAFYLSNLRPFSVPTHRTDDECPGRVFAPARLWTSLLQNAYPPESRRAQFWVAGSAYPRSFRRYSRGPLQLKGGRGAGGARLDSVYTCKGIAGSNPALSASLPLSRSATSFIP